MNVLDALYVKDNMKKCNCHSEEPTYCPIHDGDYATWKYGSSFQEWDEEVDEDK